MKGDRVFRIAPRGLAAAPAPADAALLGFKALGLARMASLGLPVPPAFVLSTEFCRRLLQEPQRFRSPLRRALEEQLPWLQAVTGLGFGDPRKPLLLSVRSGAPVSMPGMMATLLNVGLCDATVRGLLRMTGNPRLVWDSYRRLVQGFAEVLHGAAAHPFAAALEETLAREHLERVQELDHLSLRQLTQTNLQLFAEAAGAPFPQEPIAQLELAVQAVAASWNAPRAVEYRRLNPMAQDLCTAVTVQQMVFGNAGGGSGSGVGFTRDPDSGEKKLYFDFLFNSQGEDVVSGRAAGSDAERLFAVLPQAEQWLGDLAATLEQADRDVQEFEFTIQGGEFHLLQTRRAKRTPWAALRIAVELVEEGLISRAEALARLEGLPLQQIRRFRLAVAGQTPLCQGQSAGSGVASGPIALDAEAAQQWSAAGQAPVLVREELTTADIGAIALAAGVLTLRGNRTSHAAVVARQLDKACIIGCPRLQIELRKRVVTIGDRTLAEGELLTLDAHTGRVFAGAVELRVERPLAWLEKIDRWQSGPQD
jgi:pyruvate, orthophosphate dikinase